jgi:ParB/RepB/Spo0J family partition protein
MSSGNGERQVERMRGSIRDVRIDQIDRSRNHRLKQEGDLERIESLKQSIAACGQLQPVRVYERGEHQLNDRHAEPYILGFGARRCAAMMALGHETIRAVVYPPASDAEIEQARAVENLHRQDITPLEEVQAVDAVLSALKEDASFTADPFEEAATRLAKSVAWVKDRDYLFRLSTPVQKFAMKTGIPAGHLRELAKVGDEREQMRLACEAVGAPTWYFVPRDGQKQVDEHTQSMQDEWLAELKQGRMTRVPLTKLKAEVAKVTLSLKVIPWEYARPVELGDVKLRRCSGCPHNSETDRTLFEIEADEKNPRGFCLNRSCYEQKHELAQQAKEATLKKIARRTVQTPDAIRKAAPAWMKESSVVGFVKRQLDKAKASKDAVAKQPRRDPYAPRELTAYEQHLLSFGETLETWLGRAFDRILEAVNGDTRFKIAWTLLLAVPELYEHASWSIPRPSPYGKVTTNEPLLAELAPRVGEAIDVMFSGSRQQVAELMASVPIDDPNERRGFDVPHPEALAKLARHLGIDIGEPPVWAIPEWIEKPVAELAILNHGAPVAVEGDADDEIDDNASDDVHADELAVEE